MLPSMSFVIVIVELVLILDRIAGTSRSTSRSSVPLTLDAAQPCFGNRQSNNRKLR
jgi:ABC-type methionine transport system permease subunit